MFQGRTDFYAIFEQLVNVIMDEGGLEITLLMYKVGASTAVNESLIQVN